MRTHEADVTLLPINSGSTVYKPQYQTCGNVPALRDYPFEAWRKKRGAATKAIAELAVRHSVPTINEMVVRVERRQESRILEVIYQATPGYARR